MNKHDAAEIRQLPVDIAERLFLVLWRIRTENEGDLPQLLRAVWELESALWVRSKE